MTDITELLQFAGELADKAKEVTLPLFRQHNAIREKDDLSPVTDADCNCEQAIREHIARHFPAHQVLGEEFGGNTNSEWAWVIDPIDGTRSFISGSPLYCTLIALLHNHIPVIGIIDMPALGERWTGCHSPQLSQATFNGEPCQVSGKQALPKAVLATTTIGLANDATDNMLRQLCQQSGQVRLGGDASAYGCLASGFLDIAADYEMASHDYLPLLPIVQAAGGQISTWDGKPPPAVNDIKTGKTTIVAAATPELHQQALSALAKNAAPAASPPPAAPAL